MHIGHHIFCLLAATLIAVGCSRDISTFRGTQKVRPDAIERSELVVFDIDTLSAGHHTTTIFVRTDNAYPYANLFLEVRQQWNHSTYIDTIEIPIKTVLRSGKVNGTSLHENSATLPRRIYLPKDMHGTVTLRHIMRKQLLPGIHDLGVTIE